MAVTFGSGASLLPPPPTAAFSPPPTTVATVHPPPRTVPSPKTTIPPDCSFEEMVLRMEQFQQEWAEYMDWLHPPPIQPSPPSFVAETPSPPLLSITQPQLSTPPPSPSPDLQPPLAAAPPAQLAKIHPPLSTEETQPLPAVLPPLSAVQPSRPPPLSVQEPSQSSWVVGLPSPTTLQPLPPLLSTGPPLKSPPSGSAVGFPPKEKGVEAAALAAHQTLIFPRWAQQRGGVTPAQEMRLEALKPSPNQLLCCTQWRRQYEPKK